MATRDRVVIGMDPHKRSVAIEVMGADESVLGSRRFGTDVAGFAAMRARNWRCVNTLLAFRYVTLVGPYKG